MDLPIWSDLGDKLLGINFHWIGAFFFVTGSILKLYSNIHFRELGKLFRYAVTRVTLHPTECTKKMATSTKNSAVSEPTKKDIARAAEVLRQCDALVITAGAGMSLDSRLSRREGTVAHLLQRRRILAKPVNPEWFQNYPQCAWGFFGHRYYLYKKTTPHQGFHILQKWMRNIEDYFIFTSNVDGHFQKSGFPEEKVVECHGSINFLQCVDARFSPEIWPVPADFALKVDESTLQAEVPLPLGPPGKNDLPARPNILMFNEF